MNGDLQSNEVAKGMDIWFYQHPKDSVPTMRTKVLHIDEDYRGKVTIMAVGLNEWFPIYHFKKTRPEVEKYSSSVPLTECDDLFKRFGY